MTVTMVVVLGAGCALTQRPTAQEDKARWKNAVNLLALVDPAKDTKGGKWENKDGMLVSNNKWGAHIQIPYQPPEEYDYRVCFTKLKPEGKLDGLNLWLPRSGRTVAWCIGGWGNTISGLEFVKGVNPSDDKNPTGVKRGAFLEVGHKHTAVVQVRKKSIMGYLDGQLITQWKGDWKDLSFPDWVSRTQLEIATYSATVFHSIEVLEVTGVGTGLWPSYTCKRDACTKRALSCEKPVDEGKNRSSRHFHNTWLPLTLRRSMRWGLARVELGVENVDQRLI